MYPLIRFAYHAARARRMPRLEPGAAHISRHLCLPFDIDPWRELNNGRTLTLYDLGRIPLVIRLGMIGVLRARGWGFAVAGASVRWRRRVRAFDRLEMRSRLVGRDARFFYFHQAMWRGDTAASAALIRSAVTGPAGIVATDAVMEAAGRPDWRPALPDWVAAWIAAEQSRPWPPDD